MAISRGILGKVNEVTGKVLGNKFTDSLKSEAVRYLVEQQLDGEGSVSSIQLDTNAKSFSIELLLLGEHELVRVDVDKYSVESDGRQTYVVIEEARVSRRWLQKLLPRFLPYRVPVPEKYAAVVAVL